MSFHAGQSFTFGEQPSTTKWNYLWDNDYALADGSGITNDAITMAKIANGAFYAFSAYKTANQTTVTNNALTVISWATKEERNSTSAFDTSSGAWTAPANGWLKIACTLTISGGDGADDSMNWGFYVNGSVKRAPTDNWRANSGSGLELVTNVSAGFSVTAGQTVDVRYSGTAFAVSIVGTVNDSFVDGIFIADA